MAFITLGEAVDRVLQRLADQREEKTGGAKAPRKAARVGEESHAPVLARVKGHRGHSRTNWTQATRETRSPARE